MRWLRIDDSALKQLIKNDEFAFRSNLDRKTLDLVFDKRTLEALKYVFSRYSIDYLDFPISSGKESVVFRAVSGRKFVAVKIFKMSTLKFMNIRKYIEGDQRFAKIRIDRNDIIPVWVRKEYTNLMALENAGVPAPKPIGFFKNILVMSYIGTKSGPAPQIRDIEINDVIYEEVLDGMRRMYRNRIVHSDLSEYNMLYHRKVYFIDLAQAVDIDHPMASEFLERDIIKVSNFFSKHGIATSPESIEKYIKGK